MAEEPIAVEGAGPEAAPIRTTETNPAVLMAMPFRDRFSQRYVVIITGVVLLTITGSAAWNWLYGKPVSEAQDRWWMLIVGLFLGTLSSTSAQQKNKGD